MNQEIKDLYTQIRRIDAPTDEIFGRIYSLEHLVLRTNPEEKMSILIQNIRRLARTDKKVIDSIIYSLLSMLHIEIDNRLNEIEALKRKNAHLVQENKKLQKDSKKLEEIRGAFKEEDDDDGSIPF